MQRSGSALSPQQERLSRLLIKSIAKSCACCNSQKCKSVFWPTARMSVPAPRRSSLSSSGTILLNGKRSSKPLAYVPNKSHRKVNVPAQSNFIYRVDAHRIVGGPESIASLRQEVERLGAKRA